jgi:pectate lyase
MNRPKQWLVAVLAAAMLAQLAIVAPLPAGIAMAAADPVAAAGLPESWSAVKMYASETANPGAAAASFASNKLSLSAEAGKIDSSGDNAVYAFLPVTGDKDYTFTARISSFAPNPSNGWAALMVKDGSDASSKMVALGLNYNGGSYQVRDYRRLDGTGGGNASLGATLDGPVHVRMQRTGNNLSFTYSTDDGLTYLTRTNYNNNGQNHYSHLNLSTLNVGLAVSAGSAVFDQISLIVDGHEVFDSDAVTDSTEPPGAPDGLVAVAKDGAVDLSWNTVTNATYYQVKGGTADGGPYPVLLAEVLSTSATIEGLTNGVPYHFVITAGNANGMSADSGQTTAVPTGLTVPGEYGLSGFAAYATGGGVIPENDPAYRRVTNADEFREALKPGSGAKVIEIVNDLDLGWLEIPESARAAPFAKHNDPLLHPVLLKTGVSKITVDNANGLTLFSRNGSALRHASLVFRASSNIVIRNLRFDELWEWDEATRGDYDRNDWDYISLENGTSKVWIDHSTFGKSYDGVVDAKGGSNGITISWSGFEGDDGEPGSWVSEQIEALDRLPAKYPMYAALLEAGLTKADIVAIAAGQKKGHLIGASELAADNAELELTLHHNLYTDMMDRIPRLRAGNAHAYNIAVDNAGSHAASKRLTPEIAAAIAEAGFHFGVTSNGAISTEGGAVLLENSVMTDVLYPLRNNQKEDLDPRFTGAIKAIDVHYSLDGNSFIGDSDTPGSPLAPLPAASIPFAWNTESGGLPYLYEPDETLGLTARLRGENGSGSGAGELYWSAVNWMRTGQYDGTRTDAPDAPPTAPGGLLATAGDGEVKLRWGEVGAAESYKVYRGESPDGPFEAIASVTAATYTDLAAINGVSYYYLVSAVNLHGESGRSSHADAMAQPPTVPSVPENVSASGGSTKIAVSWQSSAGADFYRLHRRVAGSDSFAVLASQAFGLSYEDRTAVQGISYEYAVTSVNAAGESALSAAARASLTELTELSELRLLLEDTFDGQETGASPMHYAVIEESGTLTVEEMPNSADKSIRFFDDRTGVVQGDRFFEAQSAIAGASFAFMHESKANSVKVFRMVSGAGAGSTSNGYAAVAIETNGGHLAYRTNGGYVPFLMNYEAGVWYTVDVVANLVTGKADIYVDGEVALEQIGLFNAVTDIAGVQSFTANNNSANAYYLDNVRVYGEKVEEETGGGIGGGGIVPPLSVIVTPADNGAFIKARGSLNASKDGTNAFVAELSDAQLEQAGRYLGGTSGKIVTIQLEGDSSADRAGASLPVAGLLSLLKREADGGGITFELRASLGRYRISTEALWSASDLKKLESLPQGTRISLSLSGLSDDLDARLRRDAEQNGLSLMSQAVDFAISVDGPAGQMVVTELNGYAARLIPLTGEEAVRDMPLAGAVYDPCAGTFAGVPATLVRDGDASFALLHRTGNSLYVAVEARRSFDDLVGHWARAEVEGLAGRLYIDGVSPGRFSPDEDVTRAQFAAMLVRALGLAGGASTFADVDPDAWYADAVAAAERFGLASGYGDGTFRPEEPVTREQMATMLDRAMKRTGYAGAETAIGRDMAAEGSSSGSGDLAALLHADEAAMLDGFADADAISEWARSPLAAMVAAGIAQGTPAGMLEPERLASRAQAAAMLARLLHVLESQALTE